MSMTAGITAASESTDGLSWNILGQTYVPKQLSVNSFAWHATLPPGSFVPPHVHEAQDEFLYVLEGRLTFWLEGDEKQAGPGDLARLPMGRAHGIFNKTDHASKCLFWVSPTRRLFDLFKALNNVPDPAEVVRISARHEVQFLPPPE
jgi:quercetin dioxygenase-like cupin family protein